MCVYVCVCVCMRVCGVYPTTYSTMYQTSTFTHTGSHLISGVMGLDCASFSLVLRPDTTPLVRGSFTTRSRSLFNFTSSSPSSRLADVLLGAVNEHNTAWHIHTCTHISIHKVATYVHTYVGTVHMNAYVCENKCVQVHTYICIYIHNMKVDMH